MFYCQGKHTNDISLIFVVVPNQYLFIYLAIDFHSIVFFYFMVVSGYQQLFGYQYSSKYLLLCSAE